MISSFETYKNGSTMATKFKAYEVEIDATKI
jgi:hypothetical protein